jgi:hypothetical protein
MRRDQLEHAIRTACPIIGANAVAVVGSQSILGSLTEDRLPVEATMSMEVDILPLVEDSDEAARLADLIEGVAGEWSPFEEQHGFSIDGVDWTTAVLPEGWRDRLVKVQNANTAPPCGNPQYIGWCLDKEDLCAAKLCAFGRRTRTSSPRCSKPDSWMATSSQAACPRCRSGNSPPRNARSPGSRAGTDRGERRGAAAAPSSIVAARASAPQPAGRFAVGRLLVAGKPKDGVEPGLRL